MIRTPSRRKNNSFLNALLFPSDKTRKDLVDQLWEALPDSVKTQRQVIGRHVMGCGATHGIMERCNFACTACYLGHDANHQPPLPFSMVEKQLDRLREYLGPGGNVQITSGEVTLLPATELARIIDASRSRSLIPMVMTHGDVILHQPGYLKHLLDHGLTKVAIHIDSTQRGRKGYKHIQSETALNEVRDAFADQLRRHKTVKVKAALTMTVDDSNVGQLASVIDWFRENLDAFRMLSLQPQAQTGRTLSPSTVDTNAVWAQLEATFGSELNPHPVHFGHEDCTRMALFLVFDTGTKRFEMEAIRMSNVMDRVFMDALLADFDCVILNDEPVTRIMGKIIGIMVRRPQWWLRLPWYILRRVYQERKALGSIMLALCRFKLRIRPMFIVVHSFMSREQMETPEGVERLAACAFKVPIGDQMVSMCEVNGYGLRELDQEETKQRHRAIRQSETV